MSRKPDIVDLDRIVRQLSCFKSFKSLINAKGGYRPTIRVDRYGTPAAQLVLAYNKAQAKRGDSRRAFWHSEGRTHG